MQKNGNSNFVVKIKIASGSFLISRGDTYTVNKFCQSSCAFVTRCLFVPGIVEKLFSCLQKMISTIGCNCIMKRSDVYA